MIDWRKYIDKIYIINCPQQDDERTNNILSELKRIGIPNDLIYNYYNIDNQLIDIKIHDYLPYAYHSYNVTLGHYYCMKQAYEFNYERIMIIENDVKFLNDLKLLEVVLQNEINILDKYDFVINEFHNNYIDINNIVDYDVYNSIGASVNIYSNKSIKKIINYIESSKTLIYIDSYEIWKYEGFTIGRLNIPIGTQKKMFYEYLGMNLTEYYGILHNKNDLNKIVEIYLQFIKNLLYENIEHKLIDYEDYTKKIINILNINNEYQYDIEYIEYIYNKYFNKKELMFNNLDKCKIINNNLVINENLI